MTASAPPSEQSRPAPPEPASARRLLTALAIPPTAWAVHEMACASVAGWYCIHGHPSVVRFTTATLTLVGIALCVTSIGIARRSFRRLAPDAGSMFAIDGDHWREMLALSGVLLGVVFTLGLVWGGLSSIMLGPSLCGATR